MESVMFSLSMKPGLKDFHSEFSGEGVKSFAYTDNTAPGLMGVMVGKHGQGHTPRFGASTETALLLNPPTPWHYLGKGTF